MHHLEWFVESGGIWTWVLLVLSLMHGLPILLQLALVKKADFSAYLWAGLGGILVVGIVGTISGVHGIEDALWVVTPDQADAFIYDSIRAALGPLYVALLLVLPGLFLTGIAASLARNLAPRRVRGEED